MFADGAWTRLVGQSCHGRVTIPIEFRRTLGIRAGETLEMRLVDGELRIRRLAASPRALAGAVRAMDAEGRRARDDA